MIHVPFISDKGVQNDVLSRLMEDRIVMLFDVVDEVSSQLVITQLLYLDSVSHEPISIYINSPGGLVTAGLAIVDTMKIVKSPIHTIAVGEAASMGAVILSCGDKRSALPNAEIMVHQPLGGIQGQASDMLIHAENILKMKERLTQILADNSLLTYDEMEKECDRDNFLDAETALEWGLIDSIVKYAEK